MTTRRCVDPRRDALPEGANWAYRSTDVVYELVGNDGRVCSTSRRAVFCLDAETGRPAFTESLPGDALSVTMADGALFVDVAGATDDDLYAYSLEGELLWERSDPEDLGVGSVLQDEELPVVGGVVAVSAGDAAFPDVVGIDVLTGQEIWRVSGEPRPTSDGSELFMLGVSDEIVADCHRFYSAATRRADR